MVGYEGCGSGLCDLFVAANETTGLVTFGASMG